MINRPSYQHLVTVQDDARYFGSGWPLGTPIGIVWHATDSTRWLGSGGTHEYLNSGEKEASYHYAIEDDGRIFRFVNPKKNRAWHAGKLAGVGIHNSDWKQLVRGQSGNSLTIGIAFVAMNNRKDGKLTKAQLTSGLWLGTVMMETYRIAPELNVMHRELCPTWKSDVMPENLSADWWRHQLSLPTWPTEVTAFPCG